MNIDQNRAVVHIDAPQDSMINSLNSQLNDTYLAYGIDGSAFKRRMKTQDDNASSYGAANAAQRAVSKSSGKYKNTKWDLVDAAEEDEAVLENIPEASLPAEMQDMSKDEQKAYITEKSESRKAIQKQIQHLSEERRKYVAKKRKEMNENATLDDAVLKTVREQAEKKNYKFD